MGKYLDKISQLERTQSIKTVESKEALKVQQALAPIATWTRADGTEQTAVVDFLHTDSDGSVWAFVTLRDTWAAVNMKFVTFQKQPEVRTVKPIPTDGF